MAAYLLKALCQSEIEVMSFLWLGTILKAGLSDLLHMWSSISCSSSRRRAARSTYSRAQILSRTFWGTKWSRESIGTDTLSINLPRPCGTFADTRMSVSRSWLPAAPPGGAGNGVAKPVLPWADVGYGVVP